MRGVTTKLVRAGLVLLPLALTACGGTSGSGSSAVSADDARLKFAQCMRQHGVDIPDAPPQAGANGQRSGFRQAFLNVPRAKVDAAMQVCRKYQQDGLANLTPQQRQEFQ